MTDRRAFRTLVEAKEILVLPGVFNGYSVRLVERFARSPLDQRMT